MADSSPGAGRAASSKDVGVQVDMKQTTNVGISRWWVAFAIGLVAIYLGSDYVVSLYKPRWQVDPATLEDMGVDGVVLFRKHDRDNDGMLSFNEFEPLAHQMLEHEELYTYSDEIDAEDEVVTITADFVPLKLDTMTKDMEDTMGHLDSLLGLRSWTKPSMEWKNFGGSLFRGFLPEDSFLQESVGEVYDVLEAVSDRGRGAQISSNRYNPPQLSGLAEVTLHRLLNMFHPRPFVYSRFAPQGTVATVRAFNDQFLHIVFRAHAEFQLNEPPFFPFWFTPAQFMGELIMQRDGNKVLYFHAYVPGTNRLNVDMEWLTKPHDHQNMEVDIGYMPKMELKSTRASVHAFHAGQDQRETRMQPTDNYDKSIQDITWTKQISEAEARRKLEVALYPFKEITYYNFSRVFHEAEQQQKPVHSILLWGALDDQSC